MVLYVFITLFIGHCSFNQIPISIVILVRTDYTGAGKVAARTLTPFVSSDFIRDKIIFCICSMLLELEVYGSKPKKGIPKTLKMVFTATLYVLHIKTKRVELGGLS